MLRSTRHTRFVLGAFLLPLLIPASACNGPTALSACNGPTAPSACNGPTALSASSTSIAPSASHAASAAPPASASAREDSRTPAPAKSASAEAEPVAPVTAAVVAAGITNAWSVDGAVLVLIESNGKRKLARFVDGALDEGGLSRGLPDVTSSQTMGGHGVDDFVGGIIGRYPDALELGVTLPNSFGSSTMYRYDAATGWRVDAVALGKNAPSFGFVVDPAMGLGVGALYADVNFAGDGASSPTAFVTLGPRGFAADSFASAKPVEHSFDRGFGGVFVERSHGATNLWTLTDESDTARGVVRKNGAVQTFTADEKGLLTAPLLVRTSGDVVAGFLDDSAAHKRVAVCAKSACHVLPALPKHVVELRELGSALIAISGEIQPSSMGGGGGLLYRWSGSAWEPIPMPADCARVSHLLTLDDGTGSLLVIAETEMAHALVKLTAK